MSNLSTPTGSSRQEVGLLDTSIWAIVGGLAVGVLYPPYAFIGSILSVCGTCGIGIFFCTWSRFDRLWKNLKLCKGSSYPILNNKEQTTYSVIYKFTLPAGLCLEDFEKNKTSIEQYLGREVDIKYTYKEIWIEVFNQNRPTIFPYEYIDCKGNVEFPVGYDRHGELITCDLSKGEPHMLIAGETGSGKSTILRTIITNLIIQDKVKLHLIDLKNGSEFTIFEQCKNVVSYATTRAEADDVLSSIINEVERRYKLIVSTAKNHPDYGIVDIKSYNKWMKDKMTYEVLIVDEFMDLRNEKGSITSLEDLTARARACGIHVILATQRPDAQVMNGRIRSNITTILGLKTLNEVNSRIVIGTNGLEKLRGYGHGMFKKNKTVELQCPLLEVDDAIKLIKNKYVDKTNNIKIEKKNGELTDYDFQILDVIV